MDEIRDRLSAIEAHIAKAEGSIQDQLDTQTRLLAKIERLVQVLEGVEVVSGPGATERAHPPAVGTGGPPPSVRRPAPDSSKTGNQDDQTRRAERQIP